jgi:hypothetical protein
MKIDIDLKSDEQLRKEVKKLIEGQVTSIMRTEIQDIIIKTMSQNNGKTFTQARLEQLARDSINEHVRKFSDETVNWSNSKDYKKLDTLIRQEVHKVIVAKKKFVEDAITKQVASITKETLDAMVDTVVEKKVRIVLSNLLGNK